MPTVTETSGVMNDNANVFLNILSLQPPFTKEHGEYCRKWIVGTDFESGDDIVINFPGSETLFFWVATSNVGAIKEGAETDMSGVLTGKTLTFSNVTTDLHVYVKFST
jgi:hypothetical protein